MIRLLTVFNNDYLDIANITLPNTMEYCSRHGYLLGQANIGTSHWAYKKHEYIKSLFNEGADVVFYLDIDAMITNHTIAIEEFLDSEYSFFITKDVHELNGGVIMIKNNEEGRWVNDIILSRKGVDENEQNAINFLMESPQFNQFVKVWRHPSFNSYDYSLYPEYPNIRKREEGHHHDGDFILHTPGAPMAKRIETLKNAKIIR